MAKLTRIGIDALLKRGGKGFVGDGGNLYLKYDAGNASWIFRYKHGGKSKDMGLGSFRDVGLVDARGLALANRLLLKAGKDPMSERERSQALAQEAESAKRAALVTFEQFTREHHSVRSAEQSEKWAKGWIRKMELYVFPSIGARSIGEVGIDDVMKVLLPIWTKKPRTAGEVRGQIEQVLNAAKVKGLRTGENPAVWRGNLQFVLSTEAKKEARKRKHFPAMNWRSLPALMVELKQDNSLASVAARLLILTGARSKMVRFARWDEFDFELKVWRLTADRMKAGEAFIIPLPDSIISLLESLPRVSDSPFLFPGRGKTGAMHQNAVRTLLYSLGHSDITRHGFRSTFRDWAGEMTNYPRELCELALAHDVRGATEAAYSRSDFFNKRRQLMADWCDYALSELAGKSANPAVSSSDQ